MTVPLVVVLVVFVPMLIETARSRRNERALRRNGAIEPPGDVYALMQIAYPTSFLAMIGEAGMRGRGIGLSFAIGTVVFVLAKALKYWAIATLGPRWSFRVLVLPGAALIHRGPYRWLRHPNYVGVAGELLGAALMTSAPFAGTVSIAMFSGLLLARIRVEERALEAGAR